MDYATIAWNMLSDRDWMRINKPLLHRIGDRETILICEMVSLDHHHRSKGNRYTGWFKASSNFIFKHTAQDRNIQARTVRRLVEQGLVEKRLSRSVPATNEFYINYQKLVELIEMGYPEDESQLAENKLTSKLKISQLGNLNQANYNKELNNEDNNEKYNTLQPAAVGILSQSTTPPIDPEGGVKTQPIEAASANGVPPRLCRGRKTPIPAAPVEAAPPPDPIKVAGNKLARAFIPLLRKVTDTPNKNKFWPSVVPLGKLVVEEGVPPERIFSLIDKLSAYIGKTTDIYLPTFFSAAQFARKFYQIEEHMKRIHYPTAQSGNSNGKSNWTSRLIRTKPGDDNFDDYEEQARREGRYYEGVNEGAPT